MFLILCGKCGSGKNAIAEKLYDKGFEPIVSHTTRPMREGEINCIDYFFVEKDTFLRMIENNSFIEYRKYNTLVNGVEDTWYYGISKDSFHRTSDYAVILDMNGTREFKKYIEGSFGKGSCFVCYIDVDEPTRRQRAQGRGSFDTCEWDRRVKADEEDFNESILEELCDTRVANDSKLDSCVNLVIRRFNKHKSKVQGDSL